MMKKRRVIPMKTFSYQMIKKKWMSYLKVETPKKKELYCKNNLNLWSS